MSSLHHHSTLCIPFAFVIAQLSRELLFTFQICALGLFPSECNERYNHWCSLLETSLQLKQTASSFMKDVEWLAASAAWCDPSQSNATPNRQSAAKSTGVLLPS